MTAGRRPALGWNSFDAYGLHLSAAAAHRNIDAMAERLAPAGYEYFVIDGGWYNEYELFADSGFPVRREAVDQRLDDWGRYVPSQTYFPDGLVPIVEHAHAAGLKAGIHIMRGIPRKAVDLDLPIGGTSRTAAEIADRTSTCRWSDLNYGLDMFDPASQVYYDGWVAMLASWGFDFVKADDITGHPREIEAVATAIARCGRPMQLSLSPGGDTVPENLPSYRHADMLRVTRDVWDNAEDIEGAFEAWRRWSPLLVDGPVLDLDMIPFGALLVPFGVSSGGRRAAEHGRGGARESRLSRAQQRTFLAVRALAGAPLFFGGDLVSTDDDTIALVTDPVLLACNQSGATAECVGEQDGIEVWRACRNDGAGGWVAVFNRTEAVQSIDVTEVAVSGVGTDTDVLIEAWTGRRHERPAAGATPSVRLDAGDALLLSNERVIGRA